MQTSSKGSLTAQELIERIKGKNSQLTEQIERSLCTEPAVVQFHLTRPLTVEEFDEALEARQTALPLLNLNLLPGRTTPIKEEITVLGFYESGAVRIVGIVEDVKDSKVIVQIKELLEFLDPEMETRLDGDQAEFSDFALIHPFTSELSIFGVLEVADANQ